MRGEPHITQLSKKLRATAPALSNEVERCCTALFRNYRPGRSEESASIIMTSAGFGFVELTPIEQAVFNSPFIQRLRRLRQGPAFESVYPGATHTRAEAALQALACTKTYIKVLTDRAKEAGQEAPGEDESQAVQLAALVYNIASGPYSSAVWPLLENDLKPLLATARTALSETFGVLPFVDVQTIVTTLIILSDVFQDLLKTSIRPQSDPHLMSLRLIGTVLDSHSFFDTAYLPGIVYGAIGSIRVGRLLLDSARTGLTLGIDLQSLMSSFRVVGADTPVHWQIHADHKNFVAVNERGLPQIEAIGIAHEVFSTRVAGHPKVRLFDAMIARFTRLATERRGIPLSVSDLMTEGDDLGFIERLSAGARPNSVVARLAKRVLGRDFPERVLAFGPSFFAGFETASPQDRSDAEAMISRNIQSVMLEDESVRKLEAKIAKRLKTQRPRLAKPLGTLTAELFIVPPQVRSFGPPRVAVLIAGRLELASDHLHPERWTEAYRSRSSGYVYCAAENIAEVQKAARLVFEEEFGVRLTAAANLPLRTGPNSWLKEPYFRSKPRPRPRSGSSEERYVRHTELILPASWCPPGSAVKEHLARKLRLARQQGLWGSQKNTLVRFIDGLTSFQDVTYLGGTLMDLDFGQEDQLRKRLRDHLRGRGFQVLEGLSAGGGLIDLMFEGEIVIEVKLYGRATDHPLRIGPRYGLQARRYALALSKDIIATVVGYKPNTELGHRAAADLIDIRRFEDRRMIELRASVPIGYQAPSKVKALP